ncbi:MAG: hypothetical protein SGARI_002866 [Bacillariaceae sp.]
MQLANLSFLFAGFYADLLMVRLFLFSAYGWVWINSCLGSPLWGSPINEGFFALDGFIWATLNLWTLTTGISRLLLDEADVEMGSDELEALWRLLYRMGGVSRKIAKLNVAPHCTVVEMKMGEKLDTEKFFFIVYKGNVQVELMEHGTEAVQQSYMDGSGAIFDYKSLGLVNEETYRATFHQVDTVVTCATSVTLFRFPRDVMRDLASNPALRNVWQTIFISQMARLVIMQSANNNNSNSPVTTKAGLESSRVRSVVLTPGRVASLFLPLKDDELPPSTLSGSAQNLKSLRNLVEHIWHYACSSFYLPWPVHGHPTGMRHELPPPQNKWVGCDCSSPCPCEQKPETSMNSSTPEASLVTQKSLANSEESLSPVDEEAGGVVQNDAADTSGYLMI